MKIRIISDIIFNPIAKEILKKNGNKELDVNYFEDLNVGLMSFPNNNTESTDLFLIHSDQIFHRKPLMWQKSLMNSILDFICRHPRSKIIISNSFHMGFEQVPLSSTHGSVFDVYKSFASEFELLTQNRDVYILDFYKVFSNEGFKNCYNYNLGILYQMPYTKTGITVFADEFVRLYDCLFSEEKKVIILDCDNTLWGGILGEDGVDNLKCDKNKEGIIYYNFQVFLKNLMFKGFVLCLCSKNNILEVEEAFNQLDMPLKWNDFVLKMVNWESKAENIHAISKKLNLGENSFIFIDDNKFELDSVSQLTDVKTCFHFNPQYSIFLGLTEDYLFRRRSITNEDKERTAMYRTESLRAEISRKFNTIDDFIASLEIRTEIRINDSNDFPRISQMTEKTNQFNFYKKPFSISDLTNIVEKNGLVFSLRLSDNFGSYGLIGSIILEKKETVDYIMVGFLISCRALGKKVEDTFFEYVINYLRDHSLELTDILFKYTEKNKPAEVFINKINHGSFIRIIE